MTPPTESFEEWWNTKGDNAEERLTSKGMAFLAWNHQQEKIERLNSSIILLRDIKDAVIANDAQGLAQQALERGEQNK